VESINRTLVCSILFVDIVAYSKESVDGQQRMKQAFNRVLGSALEPVAAGERVILDTGDGAAVAFLGDQEQALFCGLSLRDNAAPLKIRAGINLGPVRLMKDLNGQVNIVGDGINVAQRVMSFSDPGQLLVSRSFFEVVSRVADDYDSLFVHAGSRTDKHVREHEVYAVSADALSARPAAGRPGEPGTEAAPVEPERPVKVFDAGGQIIISGYSEASVRSALDELVAAGARVLSPIAQVSNKWMATCEHPDIQVSACKVARLGQTQIVTGPSRDAVRAKAAELVQFGARLVRDAEQISGQWTAVCEGGGSGRWGDGGR
jgi:class 3 adenylate cyclase